ncbi:MAG: zinc ribbon domain-containing protein [Chloroflexi bacterium]|nr:zinc ribbon domain-containing protein [Chloroflexota bacterium]
MPIYQYRCSRCGHNFDKLVRAEDEQPACPSCHSSEVKRQPSIPGRVGRFGFATDPGCAPRRHT